LQITDVLGHGRSRGAGQKKEDDERIRFHTLLTTGMHRGGRIFAAEEGGSGSACPVLGGGGKAGVLVAVTLLVACRGQGEERDGARGGGGAAQEQGTRDAQEAKARAPRMAAACWRRTRGQGRAPGRPAGGRCTVARGLQAGHAGCAGGDGGEGDDGALLRGGGREQGVT
jgi:hypothetical protein